jgi:hypothetical protein
MGVVAGDESLVGAAGPAVPFALSILVNEILLSLSLYFFFLSFLDGSRSILHACYSSSLWRIHHLKLVVLYIRR